jgi:hypothetical protein
MGFSGRWEIAPIDLIEEFSICMNFSGSTVWFFQAALSEFFRQSVWVFQADGC